MKDYIQIDGQWWYVNPKRGNRMRVSPQTCAQCGKEFINRHKQKCCSKACTGVSQRGNRAAGKPCAWCKTPFTPKGKGSRQKCCSKRCAYDLGNTTRGRPGNLNPRWSGKPAPFGKTGYMRVWVEGRGRMFEHRFVMEGIIGRRLERHEEVHHKNGIRHDNRPENLELWAKRQPGGQRVKDLLEYADWVIATYGGLREKLE